MSLGFLCLTCHLMSLLVLMMYLFNKLSNLHNVKCYVDRAKRRVFGWFFYFNYARLSVINLNYYLRVLLMKEFFHLCLNLAQLYQFLSLVIHLLSWTIGQSLFNLTFVKVLEPLEPIMNKDICWSINPLSSKNNMVIVQEGQLLTIILIILFITNFNIVFK